MSEIADMNTSKSKGLAYTVVVGLIPVLARLLVWSTTTAAKANAFAAQDFLVLGLVIHVSIINELEHLPLKEREWKTIQNDISLLLIALYSALYATTILGERNTFLVDGAAMLSISIMFATLSTRLGFFVFYRHSGRSSK